MDHINHVWKGCMYAWILLVYEVLAYLGNQYDWLWNLVVAQVMFYGITYIWYSKSICGQSFYATFEAVAKQIADPPQKGF